MAELAGMMELVVEEGVEILFVQRDTDIAELYAHKLQLDGYRVTIADSITEWLNGQRSAPDIVYLDISTSDAASIAAFGALRHDARMCNVPAILLSNANETALRQQGVALGSLDYLVTPPSGTSLWKSIEGLFAADRALSEPALATSGRPR